MRSFFSFIIRHYTVFLFLLLEFISLYFVFTYNNYQRTFFINSANNLTGNVLNTYGNFQEYFQLREVNDSLINENSRLRAQLEESILFDTASSPISVIDTSGKQLYSYIPAQVIGNSVSEPNNFITLNKGSNQGITENMAVITSNGIVGKVVKVSSNFSVVMSVLHTQFKLSVAIKKNNAMGRIMWEGISPTHVSIIQVSEPGQLFKGDTILTGNNSGIFPPNIMVGTLTDYKKDLGSNYYNLNVKLSTNFNAIKYVYVVRYHLGDERDALENEVIDADY